MARARAGEAIPDSPTAAAGTPAEPSPATLAFGTAVETASGTATPAAAAPAPQPAAPTAPAEAKKKKKPEGGRASELSIMQQIARRMKRLASDAARARVYGWYVEEFAPKGGEPS